MQDPFCIRSNAIYVLQLNACKCIQTSMRIKTVGALGELVRDQRKRRGWSQSRLAENVGVSRLWVGQFEKGKETVELGLVLKTLRALDLSLEAGLLNKNPFEKGPLG
jgi:putative transcriptional regulator